MEFSIRSFREDDLSDIVRFKSESISLGFGRDIDPDAFRNFVIRQNNRCPGSVIVMESENGEMAGYAIAALKKTFSGTVSGRIHSIYVRENFRRQGIGTMLLRAAEKYLVSQGAGYVSAVSGKGNFPSISILQKSGYSEKKIVLEKRL